MSVSFVGSLFDLFTSLRNYHFSFVELNIFFFEILNRIFISLLQMVQLQKGPPNPSIHLIILTVPSSFVMFWRLLFFLIRHFDFGCGRCSYPTRPSTHAHIFMDVIWNWLFHFMSLAYKLTSDNMCKMMKWLFLQQPAIKIIMKIAKTRQSPTESSSNILMKSAIS